jgi:chromosome segregation ATPase
MSADRTTEILNYLSAIARDIGGFRADTNARLERLETRLESLETETRGGVEAVRTDIRHLSRKLEVTTQDLMDMRTNLRDMEHRVEALESK